MTWRPAVGFPNYAVSSDGQVRREVGGRGHRAGRILKPVPHPMGYRQVSLWHDGVGTRQLVHILMAEAFIGPRPEGMEIDHVDGDKTNNVLTNLEYVTSTENKRRAAALGLTAIGERNGAAKIGPEEVHEIRALYDSGVSQRAIALRFGLSQPHISDVVNGKRWGHLAKRVLDQHGVSA